MRHMSSTRHGVCPVVEGGQSGFEEQDSGAGTRRWTAVAALTGSLGDWRCPRPASSRLDRFVWMQWQYGDAKTSTPCSRGAAAILEMKQASQQSNQRKKHPMQSNQKKRKMERRSSRPAAIWRP